MLNDIIFSLPDGSDAIVRLDSTLDKKEIRVGSLGALDQFMSDSSKMVKERRQVSTRRTVRLSSDEIARAREWLSAHARALPLKHQKVMEFFFPSQHREYEIQQGSRVHHEQYNSDFAGKGSGDPQQCSKESRNHLMKTSEESVTHGVFSFCVLGSLPDSGG